MTQDNVKKLKVINYDLIEKRGKYFLMSVVFLLLVVDVILLLVFVFFPENGSLLSYRKNIPQEWVAVYLDDGATVYGHIVSIGMTAFKLKNVYILDEFKNGEKTNPNPNPMSSSTDFLIKPNAQPDKTFSLAMQNDSLVIENNHLVYWEIIDDSSELAKKLDQNVE